MVALLVKFPLKSKLSLLPFPVATSFQTAPLFSVTSPINVMVLEVPEVEAKPIVPEIVVLPVIVKLLFIWAVPPALMVKLPVMLIVTL